MATSKSDVDSSAGDCSGGSGAVIVITQFTEGGSRVSFSSCKPGTRPAVALEPGINGIPGEALGAVEIIIERSVSEKDGENLDRLIDKSEDRSGPVGNMLSRTGFIEAKYGRSGGPEGVNWSELC